MFLLIWSQSYDPFGSVLLSTAAAAAPVLLLLGLLASGRFSAPASAAAGLLTAVLTAVFVFQPPQVAEGGVSAWGLTVLAAAADGAAFGVFPIGWIVLNAIFLYALTVRTGQFEVVKHSIMALSDDRRIQALLIAFCFGAFVEGAAGFGTPVAISSALLVGAGFRPLKAACLALIANTSPVAFGALGAPIVTLAKVTGLGELEVSAMAGRQLPFFSVIVPAWLVATMGGWRAVAGVWPALVVCGGSFALVQFLVANYHGPWLVDVAGGVIALVCLTLFLRVWKPRESWRFADESAGDPGVPPGGGTAPADAAGPPAPGAGRVASAWVPWIILTAFVFVWGWPQVKAGLNGMSVAVEVPLLHLRVERVPPVVPDTQVEKAVFEVNWLSATGTGIFLAALVSAAWMRVPARQTALIFFQTCARMRWSLFTIACMLALAFTTRYSGMDAALGLAFTRTGVFYPLCAAVLGWLGVALTGSDTSSNALFGSLQTITASRLVTTGVLPLTEPQAALLLATANSTGGVMGKMIDAQSIVVAATATNETGGEGAILRAVFWHSLILALLMGGLVMTQAYWWTSAIPAAPR